jgi:hypothetical protein
MDVVYGQYPTIAEYQGKGRVPFSGETLQEATTIRQKADVDINASFIRFDIVLESHLGDHEFVFLVDPQSGEVVGGAQYPFKKYLAFE